MSLDGDGVPMLSLPLTGPSRSIARELLIGGPRSRAELADRLRLSAGSLSRLTKPLIDAGLLAEGTAVAAGQGRPSMPLDVVASSSHFLGVKLTGDEAYGVLVDLRARILTSIVAPLPDRSPDAVCAVISRMTTALNPDGLEIRALGVSFGGYSPDHQEAFAPYLAWENVPLGAMLERSTGLRCVLDNDVVALTEAQHWFGAGRGHDRFALVTIGAGIGYSLVLHDRILRSQEADIGVFGHYIIDRGGPLCPVGHRGCATAYLQSASIAAAVSVGARRPLTYDEVMDLAAAGDRLARRIVDESAVALGRLLAGVADLAMTDRILLAGEGVRLALVAAAAMQAGLTEFRPDWAEPVVVEVQQLDFSEWARGAAVIALQHFVLGND